MSQKKKREEIDQKLIILRVDIKKLVNYLHKRYIFYKKNKNYNNYNHKYIYV